MTKIKLNKSTLNTPSKGLGDTIEKITTATGIKKVVDTVSKVTKKPCGCKKRKEKLNNLFPYKKEADNVITDRPIPQPQQVIPAPVKYDRNAKRQNEK